MVGVEGWAVVAWAVVVMVGPVVGMEGYEEMVSGDSLRMDKSWVRMIINTAVLMSYESTVKQTWESTVEA